MQREHNHICKHCGRSYYACDNCDYLDHWKQVGCTIECANAYFKAVLIARGLEQEDKKEVVEEITEEKFEDVKATEESVKAKYSKK